MKRLSIGAVIGAFVLLLLTALPVAAAELTGGCTLNARSYADPAGAVVLDEGVAPGTEGSQSDPFDVAWAGKVDFHFLTGNTVFQNNHWEIYAMGIPVPILKGQDDNPMDLDETGFVNVGEGLDAFRIVGLVYISGFLEGNGKTSRCEGSGWINIVGDPVGTIPFWAFLAALVAGALFLVATPYTLTWEEGGDSGEIPRGDPRAATPPPPEA